MEPSYNLDQALYNLDKIDKFIDRSQGTKGRAISLKVHQDGRLYTQRNPIQSPDEFQKVVNQIKEVATAVIEESRDNITPKLELKNELLIIAERYGSDKFKEQTNQIKEIAAQLDPDNIAIQAEVNDENSIVIPTELLLRIEKKLDLKDGQPITMDTLKDLSKNPDKLNDEKLQKEVDRIVTTFGHRVKGKAKIYGGKTGDWVTKKIQDSVVDFVNDVIYDPIGKLVEPTIRLAVGTVTAPLGYVPVAGTWMQETVVDITVKSVKKPVKQAAKKLTEQTGDYAEKMRSKGFETSAAKHDLKQANIEAKETVLRLTKEGTILGAVKEFNDSLEVLSQFGIQTLDIFQNALTEVANGLGQIEESEFELGRLTLPVSTVLKDLESIQKYAEQTFEASSKIKTLHLRDDGLSIKTRAGQTPESFQKAVDRIQDVVRNIDRMYTNALDRDEKLLSVKYQLLTIANAYSNDKYLVPRNMLKELAKSLVPPELDEEANRDILEIPDNLMLQLRAHLGDDVEITFDYLKQIDQDKNILNNKTLQKEVHKLVTDAKGKVKEKTKVFGTKTAKWALSTAKDIVIKEASNVIYDPLGNLVAPTAVWGLKTATIPIRSVPIVGPAVHEKAGDFVEKQLKNATKSATKKVVDQTEKKIKEAKKERKEGPKIEEAPGKRWVEMFERNEEQFELQKKEDELTAQFEKQLTRFFLEDPRLANAFAQISQGLIQKMVDEQNP